MQHQVSFLRRLSLTGARIFIVCFHFQKLEESRPITCQCIFFLFGFSGLLFAKYELYGPATPTAGSEYKRETVVLKVEASDTVVMVVLVREPPRSSRRIGL